MNSKRETPKTDDRKKPALSENKRKAIQDRLRLYDAKYEFADWSRGETLDRDRFWK